MPSVQLDTLVTTRLALHRVAELVISPVRARATGGRIALRASPGGFATQALPDGSVARVDGTDLVVAAADGAETRSPLLSLRQAGHAAGDPNADALPDDVLAIDPAAAAVLAAALAGGERALAALAADATPADQVTSIDLWPEHFDIAITLGAEASGERATYGVSPGDDEHPAPYAYVGPWAMPDGASHASGWNAVGFSGAELAYVDWASTLAFFGARREALRLAAAGRP